MLSRKVNGAFWVFAVATMLFGFISAQVVGSKDLFRCRQSCYQKFVQDWHHCMDFEDCKNMCITPPNINSYIPEAFSFLVAEILWPHKCWNNCDQQLGPFQLNINSALRQGSLVITDIGWDQAITNASKQCLVTWEVSGGGLMGNLLTDSSSVELSLWLDTVYHVQVTCKHKETGGMRRSYKLIVDTHKLSDDSMATGLQAIALDTSRTGSNMYASGEAGSAAVNSAETDSRLRILKDSSKDFLSPYNPNAGSTNTPPVVSSIASNTKVKSSNSNEQQQHFDAPNIIFDDLSWRSQASEFLSESIIFAIVGSVVIFFVIIVVYALTRQVAKDAPAAVFGGAAIDKELLIHTEMLPSQTPAARHQLEKLHKKISSSSSSSASSSSMSAAAATTLSMSGSRTLHV